MRRRIRGFSMIELLVAVLVMGIGVLGITGLQMVSLQNNRGALMRAEAVQLAYDMMDRIRANPAGIPAGMDYNGLNLGDSPPAAADCNYGDCSQAQMVSFDQAVWKCSLGGFEDDERCVALRDPAGGVLPPFKEQPGLPAGDGSIAVDGGTGLITVSVQWTENNDVVRIVSVDSQG
ncbi:MAG: type IV pilus modification protein PilV [Pseudomonadales bacterium]|nr:type IV pilus modification protein PilV [Pseudomonadales bacterium]MDP6471579.1 type IV pilus modification protein PilV [Pseudomonadales bacterium]MDP6828842.1 type IV pilus modification protein PilV [Pseudomonadales bacterium]MDP6971716.1 type IV pilus modification protein PilV [Pseudomonadales bacterium]